MLQGVAIYRHVLNGNGDFTTLKSIIITIHNKNEINKVHRGLITK